jgi:DNA-binding CsgD family transcriptional regulator
MQSADIMSLIDKTYQAMIVKQNRQLKWMLLLAGALALLLLASIVYIYAQMRRLIASRLRLRQANNLQKQLNESLKEINEALQVSNQSLKESNLIKEKYIGQFLNLCSAYIEKLDAYRRMVYKRAAAGNIKELLQITKEPTSIESATDELYTHFDRAFVQLFPNFITQFNDLLQPGERIVPKKGELLNTELRIFALIRLGIDDISQIADFLRYSVNTIYNYRAKIKNRAIVERDRFEDAVRAIM